MYGLDIFVEFQRWTSTQNIWPFESQYMNNIKKMIEITITTSIHRSPKHGRAYRRWHFLLRLQRTRKV